MEPTRRRMMATLTGAVAAAVTRPLLGQVSPQPLPSPNAPANQNAPVGLDGADIPVRNSGLGIQPATWMEIKSDAQKLLTMATDFKTQVDGTNLSSTLPLALIQQAHHIEKLAKQIQDRMKH